ncbi:HAD family hydrolase [Acidobacteriota bacterium]
MNNLPHNGFMPAAVFDVDGTLIPGSAEGVFFRRLSQDRLISARGFAAWLDHAARNLTGGYSAMFRTNKHYLKGLDVETAREAARRVYCERLSSRIPPWARLEVRKHHVMGRWIVLLSGMPDFILEHFAQDLEADLYLGCRMGIKEGRFTGEIDGLHPFGAEKRTLLLDLAEKFSFELESSFGYGNHHSDRFFLQALGKPVVVHPDTILRRLAKSTDWEIIEQWT